MFSPSNSVKYLVGISQNTYFTAEKSNCFGGVRRLKSAHLPYGKIAEKHEL
jgi:hypothetical protein